MPSITDEVEVLYRKCRELALASCSRPVLLEALWNGDTRGWFLDLFLTLESRRRSLIGRVLGQRAATSRSFVGSLRYGSDMRLFNAEVPPWPESAVAQQLGARLKADFGCKLWFPSPDDPDDEAPSYAERDRAIACADCAKLIIPRDGPTDICYRCHLDREDRG